MVLTVIILAGAGLLSIVWLGYFISALELEWDTHCWGLFISDNVDSRRLLFGLRCIICGQFTAGCDEHWFCATCQDCLDVIEDDDDDTDGLT